MLHCQKMSVTAIVLHRMERDDTLKKMGNEIILGISRVLSVFSTDRKDDVWKLLSKIGDGS